MPPVVTLPNPAASNVAGPRRPVAHVAAADAPIAAEPVHRVSPVVVRQADERIRSGFALAERRAYYSAREHFLEALTLVADALDVEQGAGTHRAALAAGLLALDEAEDFAGLPSVGGPDVAQIVRSHQTRALDDFDPQDLTALAARRAYLTYAQAQLAHAAGGEPLGSLALYSLGRLAPALAGDASAPQLGATSTALVYQQAALISNPDNPLAANELGVLLAGAGRLEEARDWLRHSTRLWPDRATWHNLSVVHRQLGETRLAQLAAVEAARAPSAGGDAPLLAGSLRVAEVAPATFAATSDNLAASSGGEHVAVPAATSQSAERSSAWDWLPWR
jgi:hypothetical protein